MTRPLCSYCVSRVPGPFVRRVGKVEVRMCQKHRDRSLVLESHQALVVNLAWRKLAAGVVAL